MNFLKRAFLAVTRKKGKSLIMFVIFVAIANMVLAGLAIQHATQSAGDLARQKLGGQLTLMFDRQSAMQKARASGEQRPRIQSEPITEDMAKMVANNKNILGYNYVVNANGIADGFTSVASTEDNQQQSNSANNQEQRRANGQGSDFVMPDVSVTGVSSSDMADSFKNGDAKIISGRGITIDDADKKVVLIEKNLADQNSLKIGSKIKVKAPRSDNEVEYTVVGIYQASASTSSNTQGMGGFSFIEPYNRIYADYKSAITLKEAKTDTGITQGGIDQAVFFVDDPSNIEKVKADSKALNIDWTKYTLDANDTAYKQMMGPIDNVASFSMIVVYIVAIAGALILGLILILSIKERMYETGVLLSMGEGKLKIIGQYVTEALLVAVLAFGISTISGKFIAQGVGNLLLDREIKVEQQQAADGFNNGRGFMGGRMNTQNYQPINSLNIDISSSEIGKMSAAGILILLAGTVLPATTVMRFKPKTILTKA
ncbi:MAG: ABC transporter permease [Bacillota bacterium]|nr:ABC transporter permease [Bacillota bacterium]